MTRETKVGLVVACSFLCLVGIVVASKWRRAEDPSEEQAVVIAANKPTQVADETKGKDASKSTTEKPADTAKPAKKGEASKGANTPPSFPALTIPSAKDETAKQLERVVNEAKKSAQVEIPPLGSLTLQDAKPNPVGAAPGAGNPGALQFPPVEKGPVFVPPPSPLDPQVKPAASPAVPVEKKESIPGTIPPPVGVVGADPLGPPKTPGPLAPLEGAKPGTIGPVDVPPLPPIGKDKGPADAKNPLPAFPPVGKEPAPTFPPLGKEPTIPPPGKDPLPAFPPVGKEPTLPPPSKDPVPAFPPVGKEPTIPPVAKDPLPAFPPAGKEPMIPPIGKEPLPAVSPPGKDPIPAIPPVGKDPVPAFPPVAKDPAPTFPPVAKDPPPAVIGPRDLPSTPPIGTNPTIPPIGSGPTPQLPVVRDSNIPTVEVRPGEMTFAALSQRLYGTDKYADALLAHNRAHSGAVKNGFNLNFNPPVLNPGQQVLHPAKEVLERDYRALVRDVATGPSTPPTVKLTPPSPLTPPSGVATVSNPPSVGTGRDYTVANPNGESILDIAERVLGNRARWTDIYRLNQGNPSVQPQFRIPAGTSLKMPAN